MAASAERITETGKPPRLIPTSVLSILALVGFWALLSVLRDDPSVLPGPAQVVPLIVRELVQGELIEHLLATLARVAAAFVIAMAIGIAIGFVMGRLQSANRWLDPWLIAFLNLPALVTIVLCYLWIGLNEVAAVVAVAINKIPNVAVTVREGTRALDPKLADMAQVFRMPATARIRHVLIPQLAPYLAASARTGVALIWKIVLVVEFLGRSNGIGFKIHLYFQLFDVAMVLTYALAFIIVMLAIEILVLQPIERHATRWRQA